MTEFSFLGQQCLKLSVISVFSLNIDKIFLPCQRSGGFQSPDQLSLVSRSFSILSCPQISLIKQKMCSLQLIHSLIHPFICSIAHSFIYSFNCSLIPSLTSVHSFTHSFIHLLIHWSTHSLIHWPIHDIMIHVNEFIHQKLAHGKPARCLVFGYWIINLSVKDSIERVLRRKQMRT